MSSNSSHDTTVLVTGASGFIAMHCIAQLLEQDYSVRGTLRTPTREPGLRATFARFGDVANRLDFAQTDLTKDEGWPEAVAGCDYVLHVASPLPRKLPEHEDDLIIPAREGTLRVLRAAAAAGVKRVVLTSSISAIIAGHRRDATRVFDETDWSNTEREIGVYQKSKTLAERSAWDFINNQSSTQQLEMAVINPGMVFGPILDEDYSTSGEIIRRMMRRTYPGCANIGWAPVDVRDVAAAHLAAMTTPEAAGHRFCCALEHTWMRDIAKMLQKHFGPRGYKIATRRLPDFLIRFIAVFDSGARLVVPSLGSHTNISTTHIRKVLNWQPRSVEEMVVAMGESMIEFGVV